MYDKHNNPTLYYAIKNKNLKLIKLFIKHGANYNEISYDGGNDIFTTVLALGNPNITEYFLTLDINHNFISSFGDTHLHSAIFSLTQIPKKETKLITSTKQIIKKLIDRTNINLQNIDGNTPIHLLMKHGYLSDFKDEIEKKKIDISIKNKNGVKTIDILKSAKININKYRDDKTKINMINLKKVSKTSFVAYIRDMMVYCLCLLEKYDNIGIPICKKDKSLKNTNKKLNEKTVDLILNNSKIDIVKMKFYKMTNYFRKCRNDIGCITIFWHDKNLNFTCKNFEKCLKNVIKKEIVLVYLSLVGSDINHANMIIIDNKLKTIERFEPYGIINLYNQDDLDIYIKKQVHKLVEKITNKKYEYLSPKNFLLSNVFQSLSREGDSHNVNDNEIGGLCLAWCFWYVESRILNPNIHPKKLVEKLTKKLINNKMAIVEYIRSYSSKLDNARNKILKKFGFKNEEIYKSSITTEKKYDLYNKLYDQYIKHLKI